MKKIGALGELGPQRMVTPVYPEVKCKKPQAESCISLSHDRACRVCVWLTLRHPKGPVALAKKPVKSP